MSEARQTPVVLRKCLPEYLCNDGNWDFHIINRDAAHLCIDTRRSGDLLYDAIDVGLSKSAVWQTIPRL